MTERLTISLAQLNPTMGAIEANALKPVIDKTFPFEQAPDAFKYMESAQHFGKIVVTITG